MICTYCTDGGDSRLIAIMRAIILLFLPFSSLGPLHTTCIPISFSSILFLCVSPPHSVHAHNLCSIQLMSMCNGGRQQTLVACLVRKATSNHFETRDNDKMQQKISSCRRQSHHPSHTTLQTPTNMPLYTSIDINTSLEGSWSH